MSKSATQIRLDDELFSKVKAISEMEIRTMNAQMEYFLRKGVDQYEKEHGTVKVTSL